MLAVSLESRGFWVFFFAKLYFKYELPYIGTTKFSLF